MESLNLTEEEYHKEILGESLNSRGLKMIPMDLHIHSNWSDGDSTIAEIVKIAEERGFKAIAITDHVRYDSDWIDQYLEEICEIQRKTNVKVLAGIEARITDFQGNINAHPSFFPKVNLVLAAVHSIPSSSGASLTQEEILKMRRKMPFLYGRLILGAMFNPHVDIVVHPGKWLQKNNLPYLPLKMQEKIAFYARKIGKIIEFNTAYPPPESFVGYLAKNKVKTSFGSDAHNVEEVGSGIKEVSHSLSKTLNWITMDDINTMRLRKISLLR